MVKQMTSGFSLVEVLVSLCILSLGVIGAMFLQLSALRTTQQSGFHNIALLLAADIADQVRNSAIAGASMGTGENPLLTLDFKNSEQALALPTLCWGDSGGCDSASMAAFATYEVQRRLNDTLPQGRVKVCRDTAPWDEKTQAYRWDCSGADSDAPLVVKVGWRDPGQSKPSVPKLATTPQFVLFVQS
jgi:type IV pilus assembly protein PilV